MRVNEKQDVDYHFVSEEAFLQMQQTNRFVETTFYNGNHYGSSKDEIGLDKCIVLDPEGLKSFLALQEKTIVAFFLDCPRAIRKARMEGRGDLAENIQKRLANDDVAFDPSKLPVCHFHIDSSKKDVPTLAAEIVDLYRNYLRNL